MECGNDGCGCDSKCSNQRFQTRDYANVSVFKTAKKGYGLRANVDISAGRFIYEYVGEVIDEPRFHQRNAKYPTMGVKHFYFMSLEKDQFIDATMKGGLARFVNHSCNPNCETEKWVVGKKYRMGIFARRDVKAGEELVFDYNVDRYGAEKQPCYCGEPNCLGYIGGKTQTNSGPKLSGNLIEALGIDEDDLPTTKSKRTRKTAEEDDEYLARAGNKPLESGQVVNVMGTLSSTGEKWVVSKLLSRIQKCDEEDVLTRVLRFHGYTIIGKFLTVYKDDEDIVSTILGIFINFPKMSKNKITAAGIEPSVEALTSSPSPEISTKAKEVLAMWSGLETAYRIPRRLAGDQPEQVNTIFLDRCRDSRSTSHTESPSRSPKASTEPIPPWLQNKNKPNFNNKPPPSFAKQPPRGPRADRERFGIHGRPTHAFTPRPNFENPNMTPTGPKMDRSRTGDLPWGWNKCYQFNECYYYANDGRVSWDVPTQPCNAHGPPTSIPPPPPKAGQVKEIQALIQEAAAAAEADRQKKDDEEKERERAERRAKRKVGKTYDAEKTQKYLSIAVYPTPPSSNIRISDSPQQFGKHVPNMVNKYKLELSHNPTSAKEQVKKYSKEIVELLVNKEIRYHKGTVVDPLNVCDESKIIKIKQFVDDYMGKLVERRKTHIKPEPKSRSPSAKRKHDSDSDLPSDPKRVKSPSPAPNTPTNKRSHSSNIRRESPKRRLSLSNSPNRVF